MTPADPITERDELAFSTKLPTHNIYSAEAWAVFGIKAGRSLGDVDFEFALLPFVCLAATSGGEERNRMKATRCALGS
jgi:hypothetical protein